MENKGAGLNDGLEINMSIGGFVLENCSSNDLRLEN